MENKKYKKVFVKPEVNRIELNPITVIDPNPLPKYTYGSASRETFPQTFPFVRKRIDDFLEKEGAGGVGVASDVSTPTFGGSEGEGKEIDFFKTKGKINDIVNKSQVYLGKKGKLPEGKQLMTGPYGGRYYESEVEVYRHLWKRAKERKFKEERITNVVNYLNNRSLPISNWWIKVEQDGIIVGKAHSVRSVLEPRMKPFGNELTKNRYTSFRKK